MGSIKADDLDRVLSALGEQLATTGTEIHLVVVGGSGLLAIGAVQRTTQDVDVVAIRRGDALHCAEPLPASVVDAARLVARDFVLDPDWLNAGPTGLLEITGLPAEFSSRSLTRDYGPVLRIDFASRLDQVHFKLYAFASRSELRDESDLQALNPSPEELRAAARWIRTRDAPGPIDNALAAALATFGVEDEGRIA